MASDKIDNLFNKFISKKIYIDLLDYINDHQEENKNTDNKPSMLVIRGIFKDAFGYSEIEVDNASRDLINSGHLLKRKNSSNIFITPKGKLFLEDYCQFKIRGKLYKITRIFNESFVAIVAILALIISFVNLALNFV